MTLRPIIKPAATIRVPWFPMSVDRVPPINHPRASICAPMPKMLMTRPRISSADDIWTMAL
ncbi:MAG: hypothetical protein IIC83_08545 [Chloroflexi bacterium]|nr:hypothetical protein [Chloroflexota bacterium]